MTLEYSYHAVNLGLIVLSLTYVVVGAVHAVYETCARKREAIGNLGCHYCGVCDEWHKAK